MRSLAAFVMLFAGTMAIAQPHSALAQREADRSTGGAAPAAPVQLEGLNGSKFSALYLAAAPARAAVIIVQVSGADRELALISALRNRLAAHGYATLSVQMPVAAASAPAEIYPPIYADAAHRLQAAVAFLNSKGQRIIAIASHDLGARMTNYYLASTPDHGISAWASLGISGGEFSGHQALRLPILDLYGENDLPRILAGAEQRGAALKTLKGSAQIEIAGADHDYRGREYEAANAVRAFFDQKFR